LPPLKDRVHAAHNVINASNLTADESATVLATATSRV